MANFKKLSEVATIDKVSDTACVLIEDNGEIYRAPKTEVGGSGGKMLIITDSAYDDYVAGNYTESTEEITYTTNITLNETVSALKNKELTGAMMYTIKSPTSSQAAIPVSVVDFSSVSGTDSLMLMLSTGGSLFWFAGGISSSPPQTT